MLEQYQDAPSTFSTLPTDPSARRDSKIANFKAEKELRAKLELLRKRPEYANFEANGFGDEEAVRAVHLANVDYSVHTVFQSPEGLNREVDVLSQAPEPLYPSHTSVAEDERRRKEEQGDGYNDRPRPGRRCGASRAQWAVHCSASKGSRSSHSRCLAPGKTLPRVYFDPATTCRL